MIEEMEKGGKKDSAGRGVGKFSLWNRAATD